MDFLAVLALRIPLLNHGRNSTAVTRLTKVTCLGIDVFAARAVGSPAPEISTPNIGATAPPGSVVAAAPAGSVVRYD